MRFKCVAIDVSFRLMVTTPSFMLDWIVERVGQHRYRMQKERKLIKRSKQTRLVTRTKESNMYAN